MKIVTVVAAFLTGSYGLSTSHDSLQGKELSLWESFVQYSNEYEKEYRFDANDDAVVKKRFAAFKTNVNRIEEHNKLYEAGEYTFTLGLNHLADLTDAEYKQQMLGYKHTSSSSAAASHTFTRLDPVAHDNLPKTWDWREHDVVTPVKNQGQCGSCWAFSAVAAMETSYALSTGKLESFAEQELVDCVLGGMDNCNHGGEMQDGFQEIITHHNGKIELEQDYPYTATSRGVCTANDAKAIGHFTSYANVTSGDEDALQAAVATKGVNAIAIDASSFTFQLYRHGVYNWPLCGNKIDELDHGVAVAGYGTFKGKDFWLVKNSWSEGWGMHGYIMMSRNKKNQCGIATDASFPIMTNVTEEEEMMTIM